MRSTCVVRLDHDVHEILRVDRLLDLAAMHQVGFGKDVDGAFDFGAENALHDVLDAAAVNNIVLKVFGQAVENDLFGNVAVSLTVNLSNYIRIVRKNFACHVNAPMLLELQAPKGRPALFRQSYGTPY